MTKYHPQHSIFLQETDTSSIIEESSIYDSLPANTKIVSCLYSNPLYQTFFERVKNCTLAAGSSNMLIECRKTDVCKQQPDGFWECRMPLTTPENEREMLNTSTKVYEKAVAKYGEDNFCQEYMSDEYDVRFKYELYSGVECNNNRCDYRPYPDEIKCTYSNDIYEQINEEVAKCNLGSNNKYEGCTKNEICTQDAATGNWTCNIPLIDVDTENKDDVNDYSDNDYNVLNVTRRQYFRSYERHGKENHCSDLTDAVNKGELADGKPIICKNNVCETLSVDDYYNKRNDERCKEMQEMVGPGASADELEACNKKVIKHCEVKDGIDIEQMKNDIRSQREDEQLNETEIFARLNLDDVLKSCNPSDVCTQNADTTWTCTTNLFKDADESDDTIFNTDMRNYETAVERYGADNYCQRFAQQARVEQDSLSIRTECTNNKCLTKPWFEFIPEDTMTMTCKFTDDVYQEMDTWQTKSVNNCFYNTEGRGGKCDKSEVCTKDGNMWTCKIPLYDNVNSWYDNDRVLFNTDKKIYNKAAEEFGTENACQYYIKHHKNASQLKCENNLCSYFNPNQKFCYLSPSLYDSMNFNTFSSFLSTCQYDEIKQRRKCSIDSQASCEDTLRDLIRKKLEKDGYAGLKDIDQNNPDSDLSHRAAIFMNTGASCTVNEAGEEMCDLNDPFICKLEAAAYNAIYGSNIFDLPKDEHKFLVTKMCKPEDDGYYYCHFRVKKTEVPSCDQLFSKMPPEANINGTFSCNGDICRFNPTMVDTIPEMGIGSCDPEKTRRAMQGILSTG